LRRSHTADLRRDDPAGEIGQDLFAAMDENHSGQLTPERGRKLSGAFARWLTRGQTPKTPG